MIESHRKNWAGNYTYSTANIHFPKTIKEVQEVVKKCKNLKVLGSRCTFNEIADSSESLISLKELNKVISLDRVKNTVTIEAGMTYGELCQYLYDNGYALHNLASLPHISVAGACSTGTHGSGVNNRSLGTAISAIEFINAKGDIIDLTREKDGDTFRGAITTLGGLCVITKVTLDLEPTFDMRQVVYLNLPMEALKNNFLDIVSSGYSVSLFTDWKDKNITQVWIKDRADSEKEKTMPSEFYGAKLAQKNKHPVDDVFADNCTEQLGVPGPWHERITHFKMNFKPSVGEELQSEHFIPIEHGYEAIMAIEQLHEQLTPHLFVSEIRTVKGDDLWLSPCYRRDSVAIHFTWKQHIKEVPKLIRLIEEKLKPFNVRPHWGKLFGLSPAYIQNQFAKVDDFKRLLSIHDPNGKFRAGFIEAYLYQTPRI